MKNIGFKTISILTFAIAFLIACEDGASNDIDAPPCILDIIEVIKDESVRNPPAQVWKWEVGDEDYYYITSDCCDHFNYLYSNSCEIICAPDGGITGNGDGNCPDFEGEVEKELVWEDKRE
jgi:hypothetical protein